VKGEVAMTRLEQEVEEIRRVFRAMVCRLELRVETIPDPLVATARIAQLKIFLAYSQKIDDPEKLTDYCLSVLAKMKPTVDGEQLMPGVANGDDLSLKIDIA
jgi:hypothetical protein